MIFGRILGKFILALVLLGVGTYFLIGSDTTASAQIPPPDYKVEWTATKFLVLDWEQLFYPEGGKGTFNPDPFNSGAKTRLAIGPAEWNVRFYKDDGLVYEETWRTGADTSLKPPIAPTDHKNFATDNCYKVPANCDNSNPNAKYTGEWNWSLGSQYTNTPLPYTAGKTLRDVTDVTTAWVTDSNLYAYNSDIIINLVGEPCKRESGIYSCWPGPRGRGPGFLEVYRCSGGTCIADILYYGNTAPPYYSTYFHTSGPYAWQYTYQQAGNEDDIMFGSAMSGTLSPTKWFVTGTLYNE